MLIRSHVLHHSAAAGTVGRGEKEGFLASPWGGFAQNSPWTASAQHRSGPCHRDSARPRSQVAPTVVACHQPQRVAPWPAGAGPADGLGLARLGWEIGWERLSPCLKGHSSPDGRLAPIVCPLAYEAPISGTTNSLVAAAGERDRTDNGISCVS